MSVTVRRTPQQSRSQHRRAAILRATAHLLNEQGYAAISVGDIARRADTSVGSLYQYFPTKDALLQALIESYIRDMQVMAADMFAERPTLPPLVTTFHSAIDALVAYARNHPGFKTILNSEWVSPDIKIAVQGLYDEMFNGIVRVIGWYIPTLPAIDQQTGAKVIMALVEGLLLALSDTPEAAQAHLIAHFKRAGLAYLHSLITPTGD